MANPIETIPGELQEIHARLDAGDARMGRMEGAIAENTAETVAIKKAVDENTEVTKDIRDLMTTGRVGRKVLIWVGGVAGALMALWQAWTAVSGGGGIGPK